jgi:hypothetical protein
MSNNPFKVNNRFSFLNEDNDDIKQNKVNKTPDTSKTQDTKPNNFLKSNNNNRNLEYKRREKSSNNSEKQESKVKPIEINLEEKFEELFPDTISSKKVIDNSPKMNFKNIVNLPTENDLTNKSTLKPGHVCLKSVNGTIVYERGPLTKWEKTQHRKDLYEDSPHYIMSKTVAIMEKFWDTEERLFDLMNGEGSYKEKYSVRKIYDSESDDDNDDDNEDEDVNDSLYEEDIDEY